MKTLETKRLIIRQFEVADADDVYEYAKNPKVGPNAGWSPHKNKEESLSIVQMFIKANDVWAVVHKGDKKVIGSIGLHSASKRNNEKARMLGFVLSEDYWGQGIMSEAIEQVLRFAFNELDLDIVSTYHFPHNTRSKAVINGLGFTFEGTLRLAYASFDGNVYDECCYSMTKDEYLNR